MPNVRTRSLRTALLVTALMAAALPAAAAPSTKTEPTATAVGAKRARTAADRDFAYERRAGEGEDHTVAEGRITWSDSMIQNRGDASDIGRGYSIVGFELSGRDRPVRRFFVTLSSTETDFRVQGRFDRVRVLVCKIAIPTVKCGSKVYGSGRRHGDAGGKPEPETGSTPDSVRKPKGKAPTVWGALLRAPSQSNSSWKPPPTGRSMISKRPTDASLRSSAQARITVPATMRPGTSSTQPM